MGNNKSCCSSDITTVATFENVGKPTWGSAPSSSSIGTKANGMARSYTNMEQMEKFSQMNTVMSTPWDPYSREDRPPFTFDDGMVYTGQWLGSKPDGEGIQVWKDGSRYEGNWSDGQPSGQGRFFNAKGEVYEGGFYEGKANGTGTFWRNDGSRYKGAWKDDKQHGDATEHMSDGVVYVGQFENGMKGGRGTLTMVDGAKYEGEFKENDLHGQGTYSWADGRSYSGQWVANRMHGKGHYKWPDGKSYEGQYKDDLKSGTGRFNWTDGSSWEGEWQLDKQHGPGVSSMSGGKVKGVWQYNTLLKEDRHNPDNTRIELEPIELALGSVELFKQIDQDRHRELAQQFDYFEYPKGHALVRIGDRCNEFFIISDGTVQVDDVDNAVTTLSNGDTICEMGIVRPFISTMTLTALTPISVFLLSHEKFVNSQLYSQLPCPKRKAFGIGPYTGETVKHSVKNHADKSFYTTNVVNNANLEKIVKLGNDMFELASAMCASSALQTFAAGEKILEQGAPASFFYLVKEGSLHTTEKKSAQGQSRAVASYEPGDSFGEGSLIVPGPSPWTVNAGSAGAVVYVIDRLHFHDIMVVMRLDAAKERVRIFGKQEIFKAMLDEELLAVARAMSEGEYKDGTVLIGEGDKQGNMYVLYEGVVTLQHGEKSKGILKGTKTAPALLGSQFLLSDVWECDVTFRVDTPVAKALVIDKQTFDLILGPLAGLQERGKQLGDSYVDKFPIPMFLRIPKERKLRRQLAKVGLIGHGAFGSVDMVQEMGSGDAFALKAVSKGYVSKQKITDYLINERNCLYMCNSPFIVKLYDCYCEAYFLSFLLELASGGELQDTYCKRNLYGSLNHARYYVAAIALALEHMHEMKIAHRDVKPENVALTHLGQPKLCDMGLSKVMQGRTTTLCGTMEYLAPEMLALGSYGLEVDWWALGILTYELMTGITPFYRSYPSMIVQHIVEGIAFVKFPVQMKVQQGDDFVRSLCAPRPLDRLPMRRHGVWKIKWHPWYAGFEWEAFEAGTMEAPFLPVLKSKTDTSNFTSGGEAPPMIMYKAKSKKIPGEYGDEEWKKLFSTSS